MKKKKKKKRPSTQQERIKHASKWVSTYTGKLIIRRYNKKYGISLKDCVKELAMLGLPISMNDLQEYNKFKKEKRQNKLAKKERLLEQQEMPKQELCFGDDDYIPLFWTPKTKRTVRTLGDLNYVKRRSLDIFTAERCLCDDEIPF